VSAGVRNRDGMADGRSGKCPAGSTVGQRWFHGLWAWPSRPDIDHPLLPWPRPGPVELAVPDAYPAAQSARPRRLPQSHDVSALVATGHRQSGTPSKGSDATDTSMATVSSLSACAGHLPSGRWSFRKQRTVNPLIVPARYNLSLLFSRPALRAAALGRQHHGRALRMSRWWPSERASTGSAVIAREVIGRQDPISHRETPLIFQISPASVTT